MSAQQSTSRNSPRLRGGARSNPESSPTGQISTYGGRMHLQVGRAGQKCLQLTPLRTYLSPKSHQNDEPSSMRGPVSPAEADNSPRTDGNRKRRRSCGVDQQRKQPKIISPSHTSVAHWASTQRWPPGFAAMSEDKTSRKRPSSESSCSQQYKNGEVPKVHSRAYEQALISNKVFMNVLVGRAFVSDESKNFCNDLRQATYPELQWTTYPPSKFSQVWQLLQSQKEVRLYRDLTSLLVPSPELLSVCGTQSLEHIAEAIDSEWSKCKTLGGPQPKPNLTIGIKKSAFDDKELAKLKNHSSFERATVFGESVYFPFLLVEAKSSLYKADRQNMHSSSMAVKAILQLSPSPTEFNAQILVFSISHNNDRVRLHGHFAIVRDNGVSFYRYLFEDVSLALSGLAGQKKVCDFAQAVYDQFYPEHLQTICDLLAGMPDPTTTSMTIDRIGAAEQPPSSSMSRQPAEFTKPSTPASEKQREHQEQLAEQQRRSKEQLELLKEQRAEQQRQTTEQLAEQQRQSKEQLELLKEQLAEQQRQSKEQLAEQQRQSNEQLAEQQRQSNQQLEFLSEQLESLNEHLEDLKLLSRWW